MKADVLIHPFKPFIQHDSLILILGSFPSVASFNQGFYYMHPRNRFYSVLSALCQEDFVNVGISTKKSLLQKHHIALYDIIGSCERKGSLDASIKNIQLMDLKTLLVSTNIQCIGLNGLKAGQLYQRYFSELPYPIHILPSTSPANARVKLDDLIQAWNVVKKYLSK